ncbi:MAG: ABC transporter permease [Gemmatimonadetes bacterium]|nr:ABC transporter permease [Gemmatimonadota bacterium]MCB9505793.1 ABC transporter permease [Gemmatimonadales bacterium]MCB9517621.1 ABC transporter permease [Gemmatimonadales bacterium]
MSDDAILIGFGAATVRVATPLLLAALGETVSERGGVLNLGIEGAMLGGALGAAVGAAQGSAVVGLALAVAAGLVAALLLAAVSVWGRADQIIAGTAVTLAAVGVTGLVAQRTFGSAGAGLELATLQPVEVPLLGAIPVVGPVLFRQSLLTYLGYLLIPLTWWLLYRTRFGLELRASGEAPTSARAAGVAVRWRRTAGALLGGALAGLGGASLVLAQVGTFTEKMTAGRGFIAIAIVVLGRWHPGGVALAALLFGAATALQYLVQASGLGGVPWQLLLALPYLLALVALASAVGRARAPAGLARDDQEES